MPAASSRTLLHRDADRLPGETRQDIAPRTAVRIIVRDHVPLPGFLQLGGAGAENKVGIEEAVARVRALREEPY